MGTSLLISHPEHPPISVQSIEARVVGIDDHWLSLRWRIDGSAQVVMPALAGKGRADGLWQATCFELFVRAGEGPGYAEFNFSPSERWAAYDFPDYRDGMANRAMPREPVCTARAGGNILIFDVAIPLLGLPPMPWHYGLTAVIEETGSHKSYWAFAHPPGKSDFHHPSCFAATLPAPGKS